MGELNYQKMELTTLCKDKKVFLNFISDSSITVVGKFVYFRKNGFTITSSTFEKCLDIRIYKYTKMGFFDVLSEYQNIQYDLNSEEGKILKGYLDFLNFVKR